MITVTF